MKKRRNKSKHGRGHVSPIRCTNCGRCTPKDKAIKRFVVRNLIDGAGTRDVCEASCLEWRTPKIYLKEEYCVGCALHLRIRRIREKSERKTRLAYGPGRRITIQ